jgi:hypothetical protein
MDAAAEILPKESKHPYMDSISHLRSFYSIPLCCYRSSAPAVLGRSLSRFHSRQPRCDLSLSILGHLISNLRRYRCAAMTVLVGLSDHLPSFGSTKTRHPLEVGIGPVVCHSAVCLLVRNNYSTCPIDNHRVSPFTCLLLMLTIPRTLV